MTRYEHVTLEQAHDAAETLEHIHAGHMDTAIDLLLGWGFDAGPIFDQSGSAPSDKSYTTDDYHLTWSFAGQYVRLERLVP